MKIYSPLFVFIRVVLYSLVMFGIAEAIFFDAAHPMQDDGGYFGEETLTEIGQEIFLFILFLFFLVFGSKWKEIQPVSNLVSLFFLMSFFREFNFLIQWIYPVLAVLAVIIWLVIRDFKKIKDATILFFSAPPSVYFITGFLFTYIFSRLMGRSKFWKLLYDEETYRLAKAATEEGIELGGYTIMILGAIEFYLYFKEKTKNKA